MQIADRGAHLPKKRLQTAKAITHRRVYTQKLLQTELLQTETFTRGSLYTAELLHTEAFRQSYTQKLLHTYFFHRETLQLEGLRLQHASCLWK